MKEFIITWNIENITYSWHKTGEYIASPEFTAWPMRQTVWTLRLYPRGCDDSDYLSLYVHREDKVAVDIAVNFEFSCIATDSSILHSCIIPDTFETFERGKKSSCGKPHFMQRHEVFGRKALYLPKDTLTLRCKMWKNEGNANESDQTFAFTRLLVNKINTIAKFKTEAQNGFYIESITRNRIATYIGIKYFEDSLYVEIYPRDARTVKFCTLKLSFVNKRSRRKLCELENCFFGYSVVEKWRLPFSDQRLPTEYANSDGSEFEVIFEIVYSTGEEYKMINPYYPIKISEFLSNYIIRCVPRQRVSAIPTLFDNLKVLQSTSGFFDFELKTKYFSLRVHKIVLCAYSPVISTMLKGEMEEKMNSCIEMTDILGEALYWFIESLYFDTVYVLNDWPVLLNLYYAADKYQIERLKLLCCVELMKNVNISNVYDLLELADRHSDYELKRKVNDFIWEREDEIFRSSVWEEFASNRPDLAAETTRHQKESHGPVESYDDQADRGPKLRDAWKTFDYSQGDLLIETQGSPLPAYKSVLCASSPFFREKFNEDLRKDTTASLCMRDLDEDTAKRMLDFLHNDSLEDVNWDIAIKLCHVAKAYEINNLEMKCLCFLLENLNVSNASELLLFAHQENDNKLKSIVQDFVVTYDKEIFGSVEWAALSERNPKLANGTMRAKYKK